MLRRRKPHEFDAISNQRRDRQALEARYGIKLFDASAAASADPDRTGLQERGSEVGARQGGRRRSWMIWPASSEA